MSERKEWSTETRSLLAAILCLVVIAAWSLIYKPPPPPAPTKPNAVATNPAKPAPAAPSAPAEKSKAAAIPAAPVMVRAASAEGSIVVESDLYRVQISNRGAVVRSWLLKKFTDDNTPPRILDLVHADAAQQSGSWPLSLTLDDSGQESTVNNALFEITSSGKPVNSGTVLRAPADITMVWSDGHLEVTKHLKFNDSYIADVGTSVTQDGKPLRAGVAWTGGFGDATAYRAALQTNVFDSAAGKLNTFAAKNLGKKGETTVREEVPGTFEYAGIEDLYFAAAFLPPVNEHGGLVNTPIT
ncbi:MAG: membrane protein insertase YidC, partial [Candidatus Acidiferrales bacterium]